MAFIPSAVLARNLHVAKGHDRQRIRVSPRVVEAAGQDPAGVHALLATRPEGLTDDEALARLEEHGPNVLARDRRAGLGTLLCTRS